MEDEYAQRCLTAVSFIARKVASAVERYMQDRKWAGEVRFDGDGGGEEDGEVEEEESVLMDISE